MNLFLCGALTNSVLAAEVTGCAPNAFVAYTLTDHAAVTVDGDGHAVPVVAPGQMASGLVLRDAGLEAVNRLRYYLAVFGMGLIEGWSMDLPRIQTQPEARFRNRTCSTFLSRWQEIMYITPVPGKRWRAG